MARVLFAAAVLAGCASSPPQPTPQPAARTPAAVGLDYATYRKVTDQPYRSKVHGNRMVDVYVNAVGADAYVSERGMPVGSVVVKVATDGAIFVMEKRAAGFAPDHGDWYFALHWPSPPPEQQAKFGKSVDWRMPDPRVNYCFDCHDAYDRGLGGLTPSSVLPR